MRLARDRALATNRSTYQWEHIPGLPAFCRGLPEPERIPRFQRTRLEYDVVGTVVNALVGRVAWVRDGVKENNQLKHYDDFYPLRPKPAVSARWRTDSEFARQRLNGVNPLLIKRIAHDYIPNYIFRTFTKLWSIANLSMVFEQNVGGRGEFYGLIYPSKIDIPINEGKYLNNLAALPDSNSKTLGAVTWYSDVVDDIGNPVYDKTFDWITIKTPYQTSGRLQLKAETNLEKIDYDERYINIRNNENQWSFNQFSDVATKNRRFSKSIMEDFELIKERLSLNNSLLGTIRITSPVVIVRLEFENKDNYTLHLHEVKGMYSTTNVR